VIGRYAVAHTGEPHRIEPHQRDGETAPPFLLKLGKHAFLGDDQNALAAPTLYQLGRKNPGFERFAQAHSIGNQDAAARLAQRLQGRIELVRHQIHYASMAEVDLVIVGHAAAALALKVEQCGAVFVGGVGYQQGLRRIEDLDFGFQLCEEQSFLPAHQFGDAIATEQMASICRRINTADKPFFIPDNDAHAGGKGGIH